MLSQDAIENLIQPIIDRQEAINNYVINTIADRINDIGKLLPSDVHKLERILKSGSDVKRINSELARLTGLQVQQIKKLIKVVALDVYLDAKPYYDYRHISYVPFIKNVELQRVVNAVANQTAGEYVNLSKSMAFMTRDPQNPKVLRPTSIAKTYQQTIDKAIQATQQGTIDYNTAMHQSIKDLVDSGIRYVKYNPESGRRYTQRLDTAVRRNILDGVRAINQECQNEIGKQIEADGKEISVHICPAPDHQFVQGHVFTNEQFDKMQNGEDTVDVQGRHYTGFDRSIGTLNCRHFTYSVIIGLYKPNYSDEQLKDILDKNERGYTLPNGKHLTLYECTQRQRQLETQIRIMKDGQIAAKRAGNMDLAREYQAKVDRYVNDYKQFSKACGLSEKRSKMSVAGYRKIAKK